MDNELTINNIAQNYTLPTLHPDLRPYLSGDELRHPLVKVEGGVYPRLYPRINKLYAYKKENIHKRLSQKTWQTYLPHLPAYERITQFMVKELKKADSLRQTPEYFQLIGQIWTDLELLGQSSSFLELMLGIWNGQTPHKNVHHLMTSNEQKQLAELPKTFTIFRGHDEHLLKGISWTLNPDIALQYAIGSPNNARISIGKVNQLDIIAFINRWDEDEIVVPMKAIKNSTTTPCLFI